MLARLRRPSDRWLVLSLWLLLGASLALVTSRVGDWFDMTDELRYERLAISIARTHSLVPRIHGVDNESYAQLYPLLIAPLFAHGYVPHDLHLAHLLNAWLMTSVCVPSFLLARRVSGRLWTAYVVAALSALVPWMVYSTMLMTEVAAYPAFMWTVLAMQRAATAPSRRNDFLAVLGLALSFFARTPLIILVAVLPVGIIGYELARARRGVRTLRSALQTHAFLARTYGVLLIGVIVLTLEDKWSIVFGVYGTYASNQDLFGRGSTGSFVAHLATFSLGIGIFPFVIGLAWLLANLARSAGTERHAFAWLATVTVAAISFQSSSTDLRYFNFVHDRYMLYLAPLLLIALICAVTDRRCPRWSLVLPAGLVVLGFGFGGIEVIDLEPQATLDPESPAASFFRPVLRLTHSLDATRALLAVTTVLFALAFAVAATRARRSLVTAAVVGSLLLIVPAETAYAFTRLFWINGPSNRPLTTKMEGVYDWVDHAVGTNANVTIVPYPVSSDYFVSERAWRDFEFWNKSVDRDLHYPYSDVFESTGFWFPKTYISFNQSTGTADVTLSRYVLASDQESRFRIAGNVQIENGGVRLIDTSMPWRADWISFGLYEDGWTRPGAIARIRVFARPGQQSPETRTLTLGLQGPDGTTPKRVSVRTNLDRWDGEASTSTTQIHVPVCVPAEGFAQVEVQAPAVSEIPPSLRSADLWNTSGRRGGVLLSEVALADEIGGRCTPALR